MRKIKKKNYTAVKLAKLLAKYDKTWQSTSSQGDDLDNDDKGDEKTDDEIKIDYVELFQEDSTASDNKDQKEPAAKAYPEQKTLLEKKR